ncbi:MAG: NAD(P)/FAD-dependent oxidoreductase [Cyanobacteria bacterium P01_A01_bin.135]
MHRENSDGQAHRVVIVGGGFGGLYTAKALGKSPVDVTLIDRRNFHLFQPLLYQVATGTVSPADISSPLRGILSQNRNTKVLLDEVVDVDPDSQLLFCKHETVPYDTLIMATGVSHFYFGNDHWQEHAPGLKTVEDALEIRRRIFMAFEAAEKESDPAKRAEWLTFVIAGGGPTGVELAGAIAELAYNILPQDFRRIDTRMSRIVLVEGMDRVLPPYDPSLSEKAAESLERLGVEVVTGSLVSDVQPEQVTLKRKDGTTETIGARTVLWAAGVRASKIGKVLASRTGAELDRAGRVMVGPRLHVENYDNIFVVGDLAHVSHQGDRPLPGVAPVAMQEGQYVAKLVQNRVAGKAVPEFCYIDRGSLAVIGKNEAVVDLGFIKFSGFIAWLIWIFAHIYYLIEFDNKLVVMIQWAWSYFTRKSGARLITGAQAFNLRLPTANQTVEQSERTVA